MADLTLDEDPTATGTGRHRRAAPPAPTRPPAHRRRWQRLALPVGILGVAVGCLLCWRVALHAGIFDDTFWHQAAGRWMLDHHRVMRRDVFSYTVRGAPWSTPEWGYDVSLAAAVRALGPVAFWLFSAGLGSVVVGLVALRSRMLGAGWTWTGLLCVEAGAAVALFLDDRPQTVSYVLFAALLVLLGAARRRAGWLWCVPAVFLAWANVHGSFLLGLLVVAGEAFTAYVPVRIGRVSAADPLPRRRVTVVLVASVAATLVNPFGPHVYSSALGVTLNPTVRRLITEWQPLGLQHPAMVALVAVPLVYSVARLAFSRVEVDALDLALSAALLAATLDSERFLPYFAIAWCGLAARTAPVDRRRETVGPSLVVWPLLAALTVVFLYGSWYPPGQPASSVPVRAVDALGPRPGRVFSTYVWNDYLIWRNLPVFIDGRTELYTGTPVFGDYLAVAGLRTRPDPVLRRYGVREVLWPAQSPLSRALAHDPHWVVAWRSPQAVVFRWAG